jgi:hypothetical protein
MKARQLIDGASYGPEELKVIEQAFDDAWAAIEGNFGDDPAVRENARIRLAKAILSVAVEGVRGPEALKAGALEAMALAYRSPEIAVPHHPPGTRASLKA